CACGIPTYSDPSVAAGNDGRIAEIALVAIAIPVFASSSGIVATLEIALVTFITARTGFFSDSSVGTALFTAEIVLSTVCDSASKLMELSSAICGRRSRRQRRPPRSASWMQPGASARWSENLDHHGSASDDNAAGRWRPA